MFETSKLIQTELQIVNNQKVKETILINYEKIAEVTSIFKNWYYNEFKQKKKEIIFKFDYLLLGGCNSGLKCLSCESAFPLVAMKPKHII